MIAWIPCKQLIFIFLNGQKTDSICSINKQINFSLGIITAWQDNWGKKLGSFGVFAHPRFFFFVCVCARVCGNMPVRLWSCVCSSGRVCARHIFCTKPVWSSQGCFVCTLFSTLILSLAENNYSLFVSRGDGGRTTQTLASFYCFRGRHITQEEEGVTERGRERETIAGER